MTAVSDQHPLKPRWDGFAKENQLESKSSAQLWAELFLRHHEPHRAYHNLDHLAQMFEALEKMVDAVPTAVSLAVWFHDSVYEPTSSRNEQDSAALMMGLCGGEFVKSVLMEARRLILLTKEHVVGEEDENGRLIIDADLSILGAEPARYQVYAQAIRQEYGHVPDVAYREGRTAVLRCFLAREWIFLTEYGRDQWEAQARNNIRQELGDWQKNLPK